MSVPYRITVRISEETMEKLTELVDAYQYESVSDLIRRAVDDLIEKNYGPRSNRGKYLTRKEISEFVNERLDEDPQLTLDDLIAIILKEYSYRRYNKEIAKLTEGDERPPRKKAGSI
ncbi:MAG: ribbon-helix-helix domain-containing protein [Candidatus Thermoplasmatota archaeon]|nr:ribbon-helix-helix domain-containing protein [Candidatus Thermoplasmatota archaeon]MCL5666106.1 ribbon-helix-helix domain-containing protein [Candidatus Thermoplasmatota archaeon]